MINPTAWTYKLSRQEYIKRMLAEKALSHSDWHAIDPLLYYRAYWACIGKSPLMVYTYYKELKLKNDAVWDADLIALNNTYGKAYLQVIYHICQALAIAYKIQYPDMPHSRELAQIAGRFLDVDWDKD